MATTLDQSQQTSNNSFFWADTFIPKVAQSFQPSVTKGIAKFTFKLRRYNTPTDGLYVTLCSDDAGVPGAVVATSSLVVGSTVSDAGSVDVEFSFPNIYTFTSGTTYWAVLERSVPAASADYRYYYKSGGSSYSGGKHGLYDGATWTTYATEDAYFLEYFTTLVVDQHSDDNSSSSYVGYTADQEQIAQSFIPSVSKSIGRVTLSLRKVASPTDALQLAIYSNNSGAPGTLLGVSDSNVDGSAMTTSYVYYEFNFTSGPNLTSGTTYWIVLRRTGATSTVNYYRFERSVDNTSYPSGAYSTYNGSAWATQSLDIYFQEYYDDTLPSPKPSNLLLRSVG